jgi:hypothetical protein
VTLVERAWIQAARLRRKLRRPTKEASEAARRRWLEQHVPGRSVADIGGLFGIHGDLAFRAEAAGATRVTCFDAGDPTPEFLAERERRGSSVRFVQGDLEDPVAVAQVGVHDLVWCSGVIYHTPNPVAQLMRLREITAELLYLGSHTIAELPGVRQACVFYPYLPEGSRQAHVAPHWAPMRAGAGAIGEPFVETPMHGHANFWWGITPSALKAMVRTACFEVVEEIRPHPYPWFTELVARPVDRHPSLPPASYYRERAEARERGEELPFATYYDERA